MSVFTPDEVASLNEYQNCGIFHPFTCGSDVRAEHEDGEGILIATESGWMCPYCDFRQSYAPAWMRDWSWRRGATYRALQALSTPRPE